MKHLKIFVLLILLLLNLVSGSPQQQNTEFLPDDFSTRVFTHITQLARLGHRHVGTENDRRALLYIKDQFEKMNIDVEIQPFDFEAYEYTNVFFEVSGKKLAVEGLGLSPYKNKREYEGTPFLIDLNETEIPHDPKDIQGKTIITNDFNGHFRLLRYKPELIIYIGSLEFDKLRSQKELSFTLNFEGELKKYHSANVIGKIGNNNASFKEILISAHFDTYRKNNPGASDNASGIGVLLELARSFKKYEEDLNCTLKFVAFGGEEIGLLGSRIYVANNTKSLQFCELLFNIDNVGGNGPIYLETAGGVNGIAETKGVSQLPENETYRSWEGIKSRWRLLVDEGLMGIMSASNHPQWLVDVVNKAVQDLNYTVRSAQTMGSDSLTFAQAGIVSSGIGIRSEHSHSVQDVPENINKESLKKAGQIAAHIVLGTLERIEKK